MDKKEKEKELQKLVSLTFDENPEVRKQAALKLSESDDPAATFALLELSYDKNESVKATAKGILSRMQPRDKDAISFAEIFGAVAEREELLTVLSPEDDLKKKKLLSPIEQIFDKRLGKAKSALVKGRMMATIEKIYLKAVESRPEDAQKREKSMQKMLTSYVDVLSGLGRIMFDERHEREAKAAEVQTIEETQPVPREESAVLEEVGIQTDTSKISRDLEGLEDEEEEIRKEISEKAGEPGDKTIFHRAYEIMMASEGDEEMMFQQSQKLIRQLQDEVNLAFKMAKQRFKSENITHLTELKNGMRNVNTEVLTAKAVDVGEYLRTKRKKDTYTRITVNDADGSEGIIYLFEGRGREVQPGMKVRVVKGQVKTFSFSGETAITIGKKGNVYIVL